VITGKSIEFPATGYVYYGCILLQVYWNCHIFRAWFPSQFYAHVLHSRIKFSRICAGHSI